MEKILFEGKLHIIVADYGNGQIEIREMNGRMERLVSKDDIQSVPQKDAKKQRSFLIMLTHTKSSVTSNLTGIHKLIEQYLIGLINKN